MTFYFKHSKILDRFRCFKVPEIANVASALQSGYDLQRGKKFEPVIVPVKKQLQVCPLICLNKSVILTNPPNRGILILSINQVWFWSNFQNRFIIINQDDIWCQTWPHPSGLSSGALNVSKSPRDDFQN